MIKVTFLRPDGEPVTVDARAGATVMQTGTAGRLRGIVAECGGALMCATCHVYVEPPWLDRFPRMDDAEDAMLDTTACPRTAHSRLACQLVLADEHDGLVVRLPDTQT